MNSRPLPYQVSGPPETSSKSAKSKPTKTTDVLAKFTDNCAVSVRDAEKQNPGRFGTDAGAKVQYKFCKNEGSAFLPACAIAFVDAVEGLPREDRLPMLEIAADHYRAGPPIPPLMGYLDEADTWASWASRNEKKAYLWACWQHLSEADQAAFLARVDTRRAAA
ncbi:hypothetical protein [Paracoccus sp. SCSIO 75233]|uniref:hypothetical protein n=1 Tax=Paracoccus sp. SCSIO 75233 TaxID=3017782 RepID=UPI0022F075A4|nr:hypothetical protein [Paracoccus sp. SCSIO 75233]WBU51891.1 hypothetical protein PAF12_08515 [Paracoccus sp. SCSIO 75233]